MDEILIVSQEKGRDVLLCCLENNMKEEEEKIVIIRNSNGFKQK